MKPKSSINWKIILSLLAVGLAVVVYVLFGKIRTPKMGIQPPTSRPQLIASPTPKPIKVSESEAIARADDIMRKLNKHPAGTPEVSLTTKLRAGQIWLVKYGKDLEIEIHPTTGELISLSDHALLGETPIGAKKISESEALFIAKQCLAKLGVAIDKSQVPTVPFQNLFGAYLVLFPRMLNGYPYDYDFILFNIDAVQGKLMSYHKAYYSETCPTIVRLTEKQAVKKAKTYLTQSGKAKGFKPGKTKVELKIVQPNYYWTDNPIRGPVTFSRLAYVVTIFNADPKTFPELVIVWVDAETGELLGGTQSL